MCFLNRTTFRTKQKRSRHIKLAVGYCIWENMVRSTKQVKWMNNNEKMRRLRKCYILLLLQLCFPDMKCPLVFNLKDFIFCQEPAGTQYFQFVVIDLMSMYMHL
jgi:hypothetical protein